MRAKDGASRESTLLYLLKGFAIFSVVCAHSTGVPEDAGTGIKLAARILDYLGTMGVPVFFAVSGYLFAKNQRKFADFWQRKLTGIVIPWVFCETLLWFYVVLRKGGISWKAWLLFLLGYNHSTYYLSVLMILYLVFWLVRRTWVIYFMGILSLLSICGTGWGWITCNYYLNPMNWCFFFCLGILLHRNEKLKNGILRLGKPLLLWIPCSVVYFVVCTRLDVAIYYFGKYAIVQHLFNMLMLLGLAEWVLNRGGRLHECMEKLGKDSYSLYLLHQFVVGILVRLTNLYPLSLVVMLRPVLVIAIVMLGLAIARWLAGVQNGRFKFITVLIGIRQ